MITVVILSWMRPKQVRRILSTILPMDLVGQVIVWDNKPNGNDKGFQTDHPKVTLIGSTRDMSLFTRFAAASLAQHEAIFFNDDDTLVEPKSIQKLYDAWVRDPDRVYGLFGRAPRDDGSYGPARGQDTPIILTSAMMVHRKYASMAMTYRDDMEIADLLSEGEPYGNGEDLLISYLARHYSGKENRIVKSPHRNLTRRHAICFRWKGHWGYRTRLMKLLQERFPFVPA